MPLIRVNQRKIHSLIPDGFGTDAQDGGLWVNLGPLQYHWADAHSYLGPEMADSLEVSLADVERIAGSLGFTALRRDIVAAGFNTNQR